jgi:hypothetical protein
VISAIQWKTCTVRDITLGSAIVDVRTTVVRSSGTFEAVRLRKDKRRKRISDTDIKILCSRAAEHILMTATDCLMFGTELYLNITAPFPTKTPTSGL